MQRAFIAPIRLPDGEDEMKTIGMKPQKKQKQKPVKKPETEQEKA